MNEKRRNVKNRWFYGLGTVGRDFYYTMVSMYLMFYLTDILELDATTMWYVTGAMILTRVFDAFNDPFMGVIVDNTRSRFGRFKPWIVIGMIFSCIFYIFLFVDYGVRGFSFALIFLIIYILWEIGYTANDIAYWSMIPSLSDDQKEREKAGSIARICANVGMFAMVVGIVPITNALGKATGSMQKGYFILALVAMGAFLFTQIITVIGVKEDRGIRSQTAKTTPKEMFRVIFQNDQLLWTTVAMTLFMVGYVTTTSFGQYYFKYYYGNEETYAVFALILGVSQIGALAIFPLLRKYMKRQHIYTLSTILIVIGYILFFIAPPGKIAIIAVAGIFIFVGQGWIQVLMLMFIADCVEYGEWKLGRRNDSITLSLQPFINKLSAAIASGIVGATVILSGMKEAGGPADMTSSGLMLFKTSMMILPLVIIALIYFIYRRFYKIDEAFFERIVDEIAVRKQASEETHDIAE
jgi:sugar (glycoside-pentoside-hexuronide) transporter